MIGDGLALPHKGLIALQPSNTSKASNATLRGARKAPIRFIPEWYTRRSTEIVRKTPNLSWNAPYLGMVRVLATPR